MIQVRNTKLSNPFLFLFFLIFIWIPIDAFDTNSLNFVAAPQWIDQQTVEKTTEQVEHLLEWQIRKVQVRFIENQNPNIEAFTFKDNQSIEINPNLKHELFYAVLAHELTHVILYQKYKNSIPDWLEEGMANFISKKVCLRLHLKSKATVNYKIVQDYFNSGILKSIEELGHPLNQRGSSLIQIQARYQASTALMEMLSKKCDFFDLLQLSIQKNLETYIRNTCDIQNLNQEFLAYLQKANIRNNGKNGDGGLKKAKKTMP